MSEGRRIGWEDPVTCHPPRSVTGRATRHVRTGTLRRPQIFKPPPSAPPHNHHHRNKHRACDLEASRRPLQDTINRRWVGETKRLSQSRLGGCFFWGGGGGGGSSSFRPLRSTPPRLFLFNNRPQPNLAPRFDSILFLPSPVWLRTVFYIRFAVLPNSLTCWFTVPRSPGASVTSPNWTFITRDLIGVLTPTSVKEQYPTEVEEQGLAKTLG